MEDRVLEKDPFLLGSLKEPNGIMNKFGMRDKSYQVRVLSDDLQVLACMQYCTDTQYVRFRGKSNGVPTILRLGMGDSPKHCMHTTAMGCFGEVWHVFDRGKTILGRCECSSCFVARMVSTAAL